MISPLVFALFPMNRVRLPALFRCVCRLLQTSSWYCILLVASVLIHLLGVLCFLHLFYSPRPATAAPELVVDTIELTLAEVASEIATEPIAAASTPTFHTAPQPESAPYLTAPESPILLPSPPLAHSELSPKPLQEVPPFSLPPLPPNLTDLPEITLPPMRIPASETAQSATPPRQSTGATARIKHPQLLTDLSTLLKEYPEEARRNHWQGAVTLRLKINAHGRAEAVEVIRSSGYPVLDRQARKMLRRARFTGGPGELEQTIEYTLTK